jgi:hypothetical protein
MLTPWQNFYVIVGSAAAALIGVQFVVIALIANMRAVATHESVRAFGTPTVVHLAGALMISAFMCAPWPSLLMAAVALGAWGASGLIYGAIIVHRARRQSAYAPVWEDWLWHTVLPCLMYAAFTTAAILLRTRTPLALFVVAAAALGLLLIGVHNAWDTVTYVVVRGPGADRPKKD